MGLVIAAIWFLFRTPTEEPGQVSLVFQRYNDLDPYLGDVAFLSLTNRSTSTYLVAMTGGTNTLVVHTPYGQAERSCMVNCEFSDETPAGRTNWSQMPSPTRSANAYLALGSHTGLLIRVPLPPEGQRRKAAVLYVGPYNSQSSFWTTSFGFRVFRMIPQFFRKRIFPPVSWHKAWCDREFSHPDDDPLRSEEKPNT